MPPHEYIDWEILTSPTESKGEGRDNLALAMNKEIKRQFDEKGLCVMVVVAEKHKKEKNKEWS